LPSPGRRSYGAIGMTHPNETLIQQDQQAAWEFFA
jgi:hypothetical protein